VELTHEFTVPASVDQTWQAFNDIESVAGCFPGATVTSVEGDTFQGSCKVKLGPIALVYNGSGTFLEKDEAVHSMKIEAKGKDRRGNGTAGADVVATMTEVDEGHTHVRVVTDLAITGKPAQFGRGIIEDVSNQLLGQFVDCLETKVGRGDEPAPPPPGQSPPGEEQPRPAPNQSPQSDALDLGATLIPVLLRTYGKQLAAALVALVLLGWLLRRRH